MLLFALLGALAARRTDVDAELIRRLVAGDVKALRALYDRTSSTALAVAQKILGTRVEAEEAVQDAYLQAWRQAAAFDPRRGSTLGWLINIVRSRALDRLRSRRSSIRAVQTLASGDEGAAALPTEDLDRRQQRQRLQSALAELPDDQRKTLELAYFEGLSQSEIAVHTEVPIGTVKTRCRLALQKLAALLVEEDA